jgi:hypothetical protein
MARRPSNVIVQPDLKKWLSSFQRPFQRGAPTVSNASPHLRILSKARSNAVPMVCSFRPPYPHSPLGDQGLRGELSGVFIHEPFLPLAL